MPTVRGKGLGWVRDKVDPRDYKYIPTMGLHAVPTSVDLRKWDSAIMDQGNLGSCTANAGCGVMQFVRAFQALPNMSLSRLFLYYNTRVIEGHPNSDSGASIRDTMKSMAQSGACDEAEWPYDISKFKLKPTPKCYADGLLDIATQYLSIGADTPVGNRSLDPFKQCLAEGFPFFFGFDVYSSFDSIGADGIMPYPNESTEDILGGHAIVAVGYDDAKKAFIIRNSWGTEWGDKGYFYMPYKVIKNTGMSGDFWTVRMVSGTPAPSPDPTPTPTPTPDPTPSPLEQRVATLEAAMTTVQGALNNKQTITVIKG